MNSDIYEIINFDALKKLSEKAREKQEV